MELSKEGSEEARGGARKSNSKSNSKKRSQGASKESRQPGPGSSDKKERVSSGSATWAKRGESVEGNLSSSSRVVIAGKDGSKDGGGKGGGYSGNTKQSSFHPRSPHRDRTSGAQNNKNSTTKYVSR